MANCLRPSFSTLAFETGPLVLVRVSVVINTVPKETWRGISLFHLHFQITVHH